MTIEEGATATATLTVAPHDLASELNFEPGDLSSSERRLLEAVGNQAAVAIERVTLAADIDTALLGVERERLRSAMLTSVSHDLRTPLASIIGALSSLKSYRERYDEGTRDELVNTALSEAARLDRFVGNLLDMTRLDAGVIVPWLMWQRYGDRRFVERHWDAMERYLAHLRRQARTDRDRAQEGVYRALWLSRGAHILESLVSLRAALRARPLCHTASR